MVLMILMLYLLYSIASHVSIWMVSKSLSVAQDIVHFTKQGKLEYYEGNFDAFRCPGFTCPFVWMQWSYIGWQEKDPIGCWRCERCGAAQVIENFQDNMLLIHSALWPRLKLVFVFFFSKKCQLRMFGSENVENWRKPPSRLQTAHQVLKVRGHEGNIDTTETTSPGWKFFRASRNFRDFCVEKLFICYSFSPWRMS